jgi:hypothetical protein
MNVTKHSFAHQIIFFCAAAIGSRVGWELASDYGIFIKIISAIAGLYIALTFVAFVVIKIFKSKLNE